MPAVAARVTGLTVLLAVHASTTQSSTDALQAELALARSTLARVRALVPRLQVATASELTASMPGYQGYTFVGASAAIEKSITVVLWGTSAVTPVIRNLTLQHPVDRLSVRVERVKRDSFVLTVKRVDGKVGWGQDIWATYFADGSFARVAPAWEPATTASSSPTAGQELSELVDRYFAHRSHVPPIALPAPTQAPAVLPLLRHLGGNFASVDQLWHMLISSHPQPRRAVVIEVGVADGTSSMYAADLGVRVLAVEPNRKWIDAPAFVAKGRARPNLERIHAAAASTDGEAVFAGGGTGGLVVSDGRAAAEGTGRSRLFRKASGKRRGGGGKGRGSGKQHGMGGMGGTVRVPSITLDSILAARSISHVYLVKIDVQGFELEVLRGLIGALREQRVLYVLLEFWPRGMHQHGLDAHDVLQLLHRHGYTLFDSRALRLGADASSVPLTAANTFQRPVGLRTNVDWYLNNDARYRANFGYWTDMLAVASGGDINLDLF